MVYHTINTMEKRNSIRIGFVGCVSCGKSTLLNAICVNQYEEMKKCRTTMLPSVYKETNNRIYSNEESKEILRKNKENNHNIFHGEVDLNNDNCNLIENMIPKIKEFTDLSDNIFIDIYDIPGLNDAKTRDIYYKWIEDNFSELDIIIHIVDINSPLNTSDQIDILKMLIKNINHEKNINNRDVFLLTLVNKCDDMDQENGVFVMDEEDQLNYDNIIKTTEETIQEVLLLENITNDKSKPIERNIHCDFTPISAADTFVYRMLHNDPSVEMDIKLLQKFGVNEVGRRAWNKKDEGEKREMIKEHFEKADISDTLEITGYIQFTNILKGYLTKNKQSKILIDRIKQELNNEELIQKNITTDKDEIKKLIKIYNSYSSRVWVVDKLFKTNNSNIVTDLINIHISRWISEISDISNNSDESIKRLEEYKTIINEIKEKVDPYVLSNNIKMKIDESKSRKWSDSLGKSFKEYKNAIPHSITVGLKSLMDGYSNLQNEYYIRILENENTYYNFPNQIFTTIDKLRENSYDSVDTAVDSIIEKIEKNILTNDLENKLDNWLNHHTKTPFSGYYEICEYNENSIIQFCEKLINYYNYSKEKIINFLKNYLMQRYNVMKVSYGDSKHTTSVAPPGLIIFTHLMQFQARKEDYIKSYILLFDDWWQNIKDKNDHEYFNNLYFVNKSNVFRANNLNGDSNLNYWKERKNILAIPIYLYKLIISSFDDYSEEDDDYSSTCAEGYLSEDNENISN